MLKRYAVTLLLLAMFALALGASAESSDSMLADFQPGDLILRRQSGLWSNIATALSKNGRRARFSHAGLIVAGTPDVTIIHAIGDPLTRGEVETISWADFAKDSTDLGVYRYRLSEPTRLDIVASAQVYIGTPFDGEFLIENDRKVYCTELVWLAYKAATGIDLIEDKPVQMGQKYIPVDALYDTVIATEICSGTACLSDIRLSR